MAISQERVVELISKHLSDGLTAAEQAELDQWVQESPSTRKRMLLNLTDKQWVAGQLARYRQTDEAAGWLKLLQRHPQHAAGTPVRKLWWKYVAAAAVICICIAAYFLINPGHQKQIVQVTELPARFKNDIFPANDSLPTLTLTDGSVIRLDDVNNSIISKQTGAKVSPDDDRLIFREAAPGSASAQVSYNTVSTPKGKTFHIQLPDGTRVWLNAASSIRFPTVFSATERSIELTGEAYFEVTKNKAVPFIAKTAEQTVTVLGTHFNINAYGDDQVVKTTLLEGSVRVEAAGKKGSVTIKPGEQSAVTREGDLKVKDAVNMEQVMAWKNGLFSFKETDIETIMHEIERWYDAKIVYEARPSEHFIAEIPKTTPVSRLLRLLEQTDKVHFKIEGRQITVQR